MQLAVQVALRSHCVRKRVGAVLAKDTRVISLGYNGPPAGTVNCDQDDHCIQVGGCELDRKGSCSLSIHAEQNAILYAAKQQTAIHGATLYCTLAPCLACAKVIYAMGIARVFYQESYAAYKKESRGDIISEEGVHFLGRFKVEVQQYAS